MIENIVQFSRLLKIFKINNRNAFIVELIENNQKKLYLSSQVLVFEFGKRKYEEDPVLDRNFSPLKEDHPFILSKECLMNDCIDASYMFSNSNITHFNTNCPKLTNAQHMFENSKIKVYHSKTPMLKNKTNMFNRTSDDFIKNHPHLFV